MSKQDSTIRSRVELYEHIPGPHEEEAADELSLEDVKWVRNQIVNNFPDDLEDRLDEKIAGVMTIEELLGGFFKLYKEKRSRQRHLKEGRELKKENGKEDEITPEEKKRLPLVE